MFACIRMTEHTSNTSVCMQELRLCGNFEALHKAVHQQRLCSNIDELATCLKRAFLAAAGVGIWQSQSTSTTVSACWSG